MKKGYFYTLDAVVGVIILFLGLLLVAGLYFQAPDKGRTQALADDITGILANVRVSDICTDLNACSCRYESVAAACSDGLLTDPDMSLMELLGFLYYKNRYIQIEGVINETIADQEVVPVTHDMQIILQDPNDYGRLQQIYPLVRP